MSIAAAKGKRRPAPRAHGREQAGESPASNSCLAISKTRGIGNGHVPSPSTSPMAASQRYGYRSLRISRLTVFFVRSSVRRVLDFDALSLGASDS